MHLNYLEVLSNILLTRGTKTLQEILGDLFLSVLVLTDRVIWNLISYCWWGDDRYPLKIIEMHINWTW